MQRNEDSCPTCRHPDGIPPKHLALMRANAARPDVRARFATIMAAHTGGFAGQDAVATTALEVVARPPEHFDRYGLQDLPKLGPPQHMRDMTHPVEGIQALPTRAALAGQPLFRVVAASETNNSSIRSYSNVLETDGHGELQRAGQEPTPTFTDKQFPDWIIRLIRKTHSGVKEGAKADKNGFLLVGSSDDFNPEAKTKLKFGKEDRVYCGGRVDYYAVIDELPKSDGGTLEARAIWDWAYSKVEDDAKKRLGECNQKSCDANSGLTKCKIIRGGSIGKLEQRVDGAVVQTLGYVAVHYFCKCSEPDKKAGADGPVTGPKEQK